MRSSLCVLQLFTPEDAPPSSWHCLGCSVTGIAPTVLTAWSYPSRAGWGVAVWFPSHRSPAGEDGGVQPSARRGGDSGASSEAGSRSSSADAVFCAIWVGLLPTWPRSSLPPPRPKINTAEIVRPSNKQSGKIAGLPRRLRIVQAGRRLAAPGLGSNEVSAAP